MPVELLVGGGLTFRHDSSDFSVYKFMYVFAALVVVCDSLAPLVVRPDLWPLDVIDMFEVGL